MPAVDDYPLPSCAHGWPVGYCAECRVERIARYEVALRRIADMQEPPYISAPGIALEALGDTIGNSWKA